jgi:hypothetical protein
MALVMPRISLLANPTPYIQRFRAVLLHIAGFCPEAEDFRGDPAQIARNWACWDAHMTSLSRAACMGRLHACDETTAIETQVLVAAARRSQIVPQDIAE